MANNLYITTTEAQSGKSLITLGVMELLLQHIPNVGFFRPIIARDEDRDIEMIRSYFNLEFDYELMYGCKGERALDLITNGQQDVLLSQILEKYKVLEERCDFVLCEGTDYRGITSSFEFDINAEIATMLNCPVLLVINGKGKSLERINDSIRFSKEVFAEKECLVVATIINRLEGKYEEKDTYSIPENTILTSPTVSNVKNMLRAEVMYGEEYLNRNIEGYTVATSHKILPQLKNKHLVVTTGDREDVIFTSAVSFVAKKGKNVSGIVLSGNHALSEDVLMLLRNIEMFHVPILRCSDNIYSVIAQIQKMYSEITPYDERKVLTSLQIFERHINREALQQAIEFSKPHSITPKMFEYSLIAQARRDKVRIVLPEGNEERVLKAAEIVCKRDFAHLILLGNPQQITEKINRLDLNLDDVEIIDPKESPKLEEFAQQYYEMRKHKGLSLDVSREVVTNENYFGTLLVHNEEADGMVSGSVHTTAQTIRPALQIVGTSEGSSIVSSVFFMCLRNRVLVYGDCAINPNPTAEQLAEIAIASGETAKIFGIDPRIAMLSYSTGASGKGIDVEKVAQATQIAQDKNSGLLLEGPIQYDAAVDLEVAKTKLPDSKVAGRATVFVFPDLNTGNNTYKAVQRSTGALAIGPVLQGLKKPINDLSRGCTVTDIVNTIAITAIQAQRSRQS
ncbi:phosphate acetyltransferase [Candidatus Uabimicrobium amorphum]|uniref:Phosphate acetyltransferase n=1 Tax=Uabimicrobium amorphum TaxID=2596890 RepID=A0A5S9IND5_UABAM|nr:phosphate acetyltransferase [Candidatus Uabimicrobium amorphum]BBM85049.1 phosphate acetyltransferase [Candidatus Uabimicrobium amorphum]